VSTGLLLRGRVIHRGNRNKVEGRSTRRTWCPFRDFRVPVPHVGARKISSRRVVNGQFQGTRKSALRHLTSRSPCGRGIHDRGHRGTQRSKSMDCGASWGCRLVT